MPVSLPASFTRVRKACPTPEDEAFVARILDDLAAALPDILPDAACAYTLDYDCDAEGRTNMITVQLTTSRYKP